MGIKTITNKLAKALGVGLLAIMLAASVQAGAGSGVLVGAKCSEGPYPSGGGSSTDGVSCVGLTPDMKRTY